MKRPSSPPLGLSVRANKVIAAPVAAVRAAWTDARRRSRWLAGVQITVRAVQAPGSIQLTCDDDGTDIAVRLAPCGRGQCAVTVHHTRLATAQMVAERRHCWKEMLRGLQQYLERPA
ncbi:MAG TPA: SRPBCC domain-containing protein [Opitutaceae bacterium]|nr:SRPBCC domain-containing protein [Opitutaceae bacterium]